MEIQLWKFNSDCEYKDDSLSMNMRFTSLEGTMSGLINVFSVVMGPETTDVHQKWIEGGNDELCIEDVRDEIWDMVKPADPLRITLLDLLSCKQGGTVANSCDFIFQVSEVLHHVAFAKQSLDSLLEK
nr:probable serine/threonine-protein phosphatase 2A regulatory subunit B'' subunit TON2 [Tanacetum cinerariifolium]